ncbi:hypothetical protein GCM10009077_03920 [Roseibium denhamense]
MPDAGIPSGLKERERAVHIQIYETVRIIALPAPVLAGLMRQSAMDERFSAAKPDTGIRQMPFLKRITGLGKFRTAASQKSQFMTILVKACAKKAANLSGRAGHGNLGHRIVRSTPRITLASGTNVLPA